MTNLQLFLAMGIPVIFNGLLFAMLLTKGNHLEAKFDANFNLLVGKLMELDRLQCLRWKPSWGSDDTRQRLSLELPCFSSQ